MKIVLAKRAKMPKTPTASLPLALVFMVLMLATSSVRAGSRGSAGIVPTSRAASKGSRSSSPGLEGSWTQREDVSNKTTPLISLQIMNISITPDGISNSKTRKDRRPSSSPLLGIDDGNARGCSNIHSQFTVDQTWVDDSGNSVTEDSLGPLPLHQKGGSSCRVSLPIPTRVWPFNVYMGIEYNVSDVRTVVTKECPGDEASSICYDVVTDMLTQQGVWRSNVSHALTYDNSEDTMHVSIHSEVPAVSYDAIYDRTDPKASAKSRTTLRESDLQPSLSSKRSGETSMLAKASNVRREAIPIHALATARKGTSPQAFWINQTTYSISMVDEVFQVNALIASLQGLVNRKSGAQLYIQYPPEWAYTYTPIVREYFESRHGFNFTQLEWGLGAVETLLPYADVKGYVVWDDQVRESLVVAYTISGIENALVVHRNQVDTVESLGLPLIANLTNQFRNMTATGIYRWAKDEYWDRTSKSFLVWAGGACKDLTMEPGIMDFGVKERAFFADLSTVAPPSSFSGSKAETETDEEVMSNTVTDHPYVKDEYDLAKEMVSEMNDEFVMLGWHNYCKDEEHDYTTLVSANGGRVHGLNTNPNLSFQSQVDVSPDFVFKNQHSQGSKKRGESGENEVEGAIDCERMHEKTYIVLVQTDGLGLGAWVQPGRGSLPYTWEVTLPDYEIQPVLLQMFYEQATPNDYFVGCLGGPGYMYPNAVPSSLLPRRLQKTQTLLNHLDLEAFVVFDASRARGSHTVCSDTNLAPNVVDAYFENMPNVTAFFNGYAPSFTFAKAQNEVTGRNQTLLSFNYYLDPDRSIEDATQDILELANLNSKRPYFLPIHVREFSTVGKAAEIIAGLPEETFEVIPGDIFTMYLNKCGDVPSRNQ